MTPSTESPTAESTRDVTGTIRRGRPTKAQTADRPPTRIRILDAAVELLQERGSGGLSMDQVAARVGITPSALYRHFRDKADLVRAALPHVAERSSPATWRSRESSVHIEVLPTMLRQVASGQMVRIRQFLNNVVAASPDDPVVAAQIAGLNADLAAAFERGLANGQAAGDVRAGLDTHFAARLLLVLLAGLTEVDTIDPTLTGDVAWAEFVCDAVTSVLFDHDRLMAAGPSPDPASPPVGSDAPSAAAPRRSRRPR